jgi:hypothetical protein
MISNFTPSLTCSGTERWGETVSQSKALNSPCGRTKDAVCTNLDNILVKEKFL